jgi:hypothetical protein
VSLLLRIKGYLKNDWRTKRGAKVSRIESVAPNRDILMRTLCKVRGLRLETGASGISATEAGRFAVQDIKMRTVGDKNGDTKMQKSGHPLEVQVNRVA